MDTAHLSAYYRGLGDGVAVTEASEAAIRFQVTDV
jgi:hypothetical protein